ncbi:MAG: hypothetical protein LBM99_00005 [Bacillales bacterium]|jgi:prephenate dehydratase|nr:hypothetical protein [Bacillales bacterium]
MKKVAVLGSVGTFTHIACEQFRQLLSEEFEVLFFDSLPLCFKAFKELDYLILPIENSIDGFIQRNLDLLFDYKAFVIDSLVLDIDFKLISNCDSIEDIKKIYTFYKSANQCSLFLETIPATLIETKHNMDSLKCFLANPQEAGAIIPTHIDTSSKLIKSNIVDNLDNKTRFFLVSHELKTELLNKTLVKILLAVTPSLDHPGILVDILSVFKEKMVNLSSIMSRPVKTKLGKYHFFLEIDTDKKHYKEVLDYISLLDREYNCCILGVF